MDERETMIDSFRLHQPEPSHHGLFCYRPTDWGKPCGRVAACDTPGCPLDDERGLLE